MSMFHVNPTKSWQSRKRGVCHCFHCFFFKRSGPKSSAWNGFILGGWFFVLFFLSRNGPMAILLHFVRYWKQWRCISAKWFSNRDAACRTRAGMYRVQWFILDAQPVFWQSLVSCFVKCGFKHLIPVFETRMNHYTNLWHPRTGYCNRHILYTKNWAQTKPAWLLSAEYYAAKKNSSMHCKASTLHR